MAPASYMKKGEGSSLLTWINVDGDNNMKVHGDDEQQPTFVVCCLVAMSLSARHLNGLGQTWDRG